MIRLRIKFYLMRRTRKDAENRVRNHTDGMFDVASFSISPFMLSSSCKSVSEASGEMKFGILAGEPKTTYHALRPWLDLRIWKSKDFLMYNFSAADQSTAAGHEDPPTHHHHPHPLCDQYSIFRLSAPLSASISERRLHLTLTTLDYSQAKVPFNSQGPWRRTHPTPWSPLPTFLLHPLRLYRRAQPPTCLLTLSLLLLAPAWVINYLMESIRC